MRGIIILGLFFALAQGAFAITITLDFSTDTGNFFAPGSEARDTLEAATGFFESIIGDELAAITPTTTWNPPASPFDDMWQATFVNPSTGTPDNRDQLSVPADSIILFVGARNLGGGEYAEGSHGGYTYSTFDPAFAEAVGSRGQGPNEVGIWGGSLAIDTTTPWNLDHDVLPGAGEIDLYSAILHEMGHILGFGFIDPGPGTSPFESLINTASDPDTFAGPEAVALFGGEPQLDAATFNAHWAEGITSTVFGGGASQEPALTHGLDPGERKHFTDLDVAALDDLGWDIVPEPSRAFLIFLGLGAVFVNRQRRQKGERQVASGSLPPPV